MLRELPISEIRCCRATHYDTYDFDKTEQKQQMHLGNAVSDKGDVGWPLMLSDLMSSGFFLCGAERKVYIIEPFHLNDAIERRIRALHDVTRWEGHGETCAEGSTTTRKFNN